MRSGLIFSVSSRFANRYLLCRMLSASARKMHRDGVSTSQSINNSLRALRDAEQQPDGEQPNAAALPPGMVPEPQMLDQEEAAAQAR
jgi:hypothetical protein